MKPAMDNKEKSIVPIKNKAIKKLNEPIFTGLFPKYANAPNAANKNNTPIPDKFLNSHSRHESFLKIAINNQTTKLNTKAIAENKLPNKRVRSNIICVNGTFSKYAIYRLYSLVK